MDRWEVDSNYAILEINRWLGKNDDSICYIGIIDNMPIATGVFDIISDVDEKLGPWNTLLWIDPKYRGNNYGRLLFEKRIEYAKSKGYKNIYLDTVNAENYHLKFGWKTIDKLKYHNEVVTIMKLDINS